MKKLKWVVLTLALMTGIAVLINYDRLMPQEPEADDAEGYLGDADFVYNTEDGKSEYFASARYNREKKRDESVAALNTVINDSAATAESKDKAYDELQSYAFSESCEAAVESLIRAKGFGECIAFVGRENASVVVSESTLTRAQAAQITDIVVSQTGFSPSKVTVIEYNAGNEGSSDENIGTENE